MEFTHRFAYTSLLAEMQNYSEIVNVVDQNGHLALRSGANAGNVVLVNDKTSAANFSNPCRHIIYFLRSKDVDSFVADLCHNKWLKKHLPAHLTGETQVATGPRVLSQMEKYRKVHEVTDKIAEIVSEKPSALFTTYFNVWKECERAIADNNIFEIELRNENGKQNVFSLYSVHVYSWLYFFHIVAIGQGGDPAPNADSPPVNLPLPDNPTVKLKLILSLWFICAQ